MSYRMSRLIRSVQKLNKVVLNEIFGYNDGSPSVKLTANLDFSLAANTGITLSKTDDWVARVTTANDALLFQGGDGTSVKQGWVGGNVSYDFGANLVSFNVTDGNVAVTMDRANVTVIADGVHLKRDDSWPLRTAAVHTENDALHVDPLRDYGNGVMIAGNTMHLLDGNAWFSGNVTIDGNNHGIMTKNINHDGTNLYVGSSFTSFEGVVHHKWPALVKVVQLSNAQYNDGVQLHLTENNWFSYEVVDQNTASLTTALFRSKRAYVSSVHEHDKDRVLTNEPLDIEYMYERMDGESKRVWVRIKQDMRLQQGGVATFLVSLTDNDSLDGAGMMTTTLPSLIPTDGIQDDFERSVRWRARSGWVTRFGKMLPLTERPRWEVSGGNMLIRSGGPTSYLTAVDYEDGSYQLWKVDRDSITGAESHHKVMGVFGDEVVFSDRVSTVNDMTTYGNLFTRGNVTTVNTVTALEDVNITNDKSLNTGHINSDTQQLHVHSAITTFDGVVQFEKQPAIKVLQLFDTQTNNDILVSKSTPGTFTIDVVDENTVSLADALLYSQRIYVSGITEHNESTPLMNESFAVTGISEQLSASARQVVVHIDKPLRLQEMGLATFFVEMSAWDGAGMVLKGTETGVRWRARKGWTNRPLMDRSQWEVSGGNLLLKSVGSTSYVAAAEDTDGSFQLWKADTNQKVLTADPSGLDVTGGVRVRKNLIVDGTITEASDARLKSDVRHLTGALSKVQALQGVTYLKGDATGRNVGLIAQHVQQVIPEVVSQDDAGMLSVAYGNLVALLVEAIKDLSQEVQTLKGRLDTQN